MSIMIHWLEVRHDDNSDLLKTSDNKVGNLLKHGDVSDIYQIENGDDISSLTVRFPLLERHCSIDDKVMYIGKKMRITDEFPYKLDRFWKVRYGLIDDEGNKCKVFEEDLEKIK